MNLHLILQTQAILLLFLGGVVLLAHNTSRSRNANSSARWFFAACVCGGLGLLLQSERGHLHPALSVVLGNFLFLALTALLTRAIALATQSRSRRSLVFMAMGIAATLVLLTVFTFVRPDVTVRVLVASIALPVLLTPANVMLLRSSERVTQAARYTLSGVLTVFSLGCVLRIISLLHGAHPESGANWTGAILIAGVAMCFLWIDLLRTRAELERQAMTDPLTGLLNRRAFDWMAPRELARAERTRTAVTMLTLDVDDFKTINDRYGHVQGDAALRGVAGVLNSTLRATDIAVRTGGDEFLVLLSASSVADAEYISARLQVGIEALRIVSPEQHVFGISVTIGSFTTEPGAQVSFLDLLHRSDQELYRRKQKRAQAGSASPALGSLWPAAPTSNPPN